MSRRWWVILPVFLALCHTGSFDCVMAQGRNPAETADSKSAAATARSKRIKNRRSQENVAIKFARLHHAELSKLLPRLKRTDRAQYDQAVQELSRTSERLNRLRDSNQLRYEQALERWKLDSRIRLLAARMTMSADPALEFEIKALLQERLQLRLQQLTADRDRVQTRLGKLNDSINAIASDRDEAAQKEFDRLKKSLARSTLKSNSRSRQTSKKRPVTDKTRRTSTTSRPVKSNPSTKSGTGKR